MAKWIAALLLMLAGLPATAQEFNVWAPDDHPTRMNASGNGTCTAINGGNCTMSLASLALPTSPWASVPVRSVLVYACACSSTSAASNCNPTGITGGTNLTNQTNSATTMRMSVNYVFVTDVTLTETITCVGSGGSADATAGVAYAFFPADINSPIDATTTTSSGNSTNPDPAAITPATDGTRLMAVCASPNNDNALTGPAAYTTPTGTIADDTGTDVSIWAAITILNKKGTSEDPGAYGSWVTGAWVCATVNTRGRQ